MKITNVRAVMSFVPGTIRYKKATDGRPNLSYIAASGNIYNNCTGNQNTGLGNPDNDGNDPGPWIPPYAYTWDAAADVPAFVTAAAGAQ